MALNPASNKFAARTRDVNALEKSCLALLKGPVKRVMEETQYGSKEVARQRGPGRGPRAGAPGLGARGQLFQRRRLLQQRRKRLQALAVVLQVARGGRDK